MLPLNTVARTKALLAPHYKFVCSFRPQRLTFSSGLPQRSTPNFHTARQWYTEIRGSPITGQIGDVSYSRSSGPGGQNVNKCDLRFRVGVASCADTIRVNSKAQLRITMSELLPLLPNVLHTGIKSSRYYSEKTSSLLIQCDESRKQAANKDACYRRLNELILSIYHHAVPGETSEEQKEKVKGLKQAENEARLRLKKHVSSKKASRRGGYD